MAKCIIHTDYVDPTKTDEILQRCAKVISEALKNAPSGTGIPSGAKQKNNNMSITQEGGGNQSGNMNL